AARLADEAEELAAAQTERDAVDRVDDRAAAGNASAGPEVLDEIAHLEDGGIGLGSHSGPGWKQATRWFGATSRSSGTRVRGRSSARGQRSANAHIVGSSRSDGTRPGISRSLRRASSLSYGRGIAFRSPIVYGCCGSA